MHYLRLRKVGSVGTPERLRAIRGAGSIDVYGYRVIGGTGHPLAHAQGKVPEHRAVLYDAIGPGKHPCNWCSKTLTWDGPAATRINADHLDDDRLNNTPRNLVPACLRCNTSRGRAIA